MKRLTLNTAELIFTADIKLTGIVEYGIGWELINAGDQLLPAAGARFDHTFQGILNGPRFNGSIHGVSYSNHRPDGRYESHLHGRITTVDKANISLWSEKVSLQPVRSRESLIRSIGSLFTLSRSYQWLNRLQVWAVGSLNKDLGEVKIRAYSV